jgi:hypothetical protein
MSTVRFASWAQTAVGQAIKTPDAAGSLPAATFAPAITLLEAGVAKTPPLTGPTMTMLGPESVGQLDPRAVVRTDPAAGASEVEDNYLVSVDLQPIELPWMFTPAAPNPDGRLRPWIVLVVVEVAGSTLTDGVAPLLTVGTDQLPDLTDSWGWAHVQLADEPADQVARLLCPRRLNPTTRYRACIVPSFTYSGDSAGPGTYAPAWNIGAATATLPVYYSWEFGTGDDGDFESLVRRLGPAPTDRVTNLGTALIDVQRPWTDDRPLAGAPAPAPLTVAGALCQLHATSTGQSDLPATVLTDFVGRLAAQCNTAAGLFDGSAGQSAVAPPIYGGLHVNRNQIPADPTKAADWVDQLNVEIPNRIAAGLGSAYVRANQESLMARAWEQVGAIREANRRRAMGQLATNVTAAMHAKHVANLELGELVSLSAPAAARTRPWTDGPPLATAIAVSTLPTAAASTAFSRFVRPHGPIGRATQVRSSEVIGRAMTGAIAVPAVTSGPSLTVAASVTPPSPAPSGSMADDAVQAHRAFAAATELVTLNAFADTARVSGLTAPAAALSSHLTGLPVDADAVRDGDVERVRRSITSSALVTVSTGISTARGLLTIAELGSTGAAATAVGVQLDSTSLHAQLTDALHPGDRIARRIAAAVTMPDRYGDPLSLDQVMDYPVFPAPMALGLLGSAPEWFLPGLGAFPADSTTLLAPNSNFIESFLVGLANEFNRELLWREYPTDMRGTPFRNFWPRSDSGADIPPIHIWFGDLGSHLALGSDDVAVLLVRGSVIRRFPNLLIAAAPAVQAVPGQLPVPDENTATWQAPLFVVPVDEQTTACAFSLAPDVLRAPPTETQPGWFFAFQEHSARIRFGFDVGNATFDNWQDLDWPRVLSASAQISPGRPFARADATIAPTSPGDMQWNRDAADVARIALQHPFRLLIHASELVAP